MEKKTFFTETSPCIHWEFWMHINEDILHLHKGTVFVKVPSTLVNRFRNTVRLPSKRESKRPLAVFNKTTVATVPTTPTQVAKSLGLTSLTVGSISNQRRSEGFCYLKMTREVYTLAIVSYVSFYHMVQYTPNLWYKPHRIPKLKCFSSRFTVVFAQSIEARC